MISKGKACGKFILLGEHFVIPAGPEAGAVAPVAALAFPLNELWCEVRVEPKPHPHYKAKLAGEEDRATIESLMARATYAAGSALGIDISGQPLHVESSANFPISRGFGSSAAFAVALVRALDAYRKTITQQSADWRELQKATSAVEHIFHGRPSGVDTAVILAGRPIRFEDGAVVRELKNVAVDFVVVDSGSRDNCAALVKEVVAFRERNQAQWSRMAEALRGLANDAERALVSGQGTVLAKTIAESHGILAELGLSNPGIDAIIREGISFGALAGKVSGAGGGGAVLLATAKGEGKRVAQALRDAGRSVVGVDLVNGADNG